MHLSQKGVAWRGDSRLILVAFSLRVSANSSLNLDPESNRELLLFVPKWRDWERVTDYRSCHFLLDILQTSPEGKLLEAAARVLQGH